MYKKGLGVLGLFVLTYLYGVLCVSEIGHVKYVLLPVVDMKMDERVLAEQTSNTIGIINTAISGQRSLGVREIIRDPYALSKEDKELLKRIVEAEAGNQDEEGRILVANVVLNRMENDDFPNTVKEVILQKENGVSQFSPVSNGRIWSVQISEETDEAVLRALQGEDLSEGALYFVSRKYADSEKMKWFDNHLTYLFEHGGHEFFK